MIPTLFNSGVFGKPASGGGAVGGWVELARTTLGSASSTITVSSLPDKRYYKILTSITGQASNSDVSMRLNGDTGSNYARRFSTNGGSDITGTVTSLPYHYTDAAKTTPIFAMAYLANKSDKEKLSISHGVRETGVTAGTPSRFESVGKWANTSSAVNEIQVLGSSNFNSGSECVVLGWDPADTHTNNFWEELASVDVTTGTTIDTGSFTSKKYLWVQTYIDDAASISYHYRFNSDSASNYSRRKSNNGGSDLTGTSETEIIPNHGFGTHPHYDNMFIINNTSNEKLGIIHRISQGIAGAVNAPNRQEAVFKWANTSSQISSIQMINAASVDRCIIKVWGAD